MRILPFFVFLGRGEILDKQIQIFNHDELGRIRALEINGEPWFVGKDVAAALGYGNTRDAISKHVDDEDKRTFLRSQITTLEIPNRGLTFINESGLYSLILSSKLPTAKKFKRWITSEILPSIRKTGAYSAANVFENPANIALLCRGYLELAAKSAELSPKVRYYDMILQSANLVQTGIIAKDYGMSAVSSNNLLHDMGIQFKIGGTWLLYQKYTGLGYTKSRTYRASENTSVIHTYWTQKGRLFLYNLLKQHGILPNMETENAAEYEDGGAY